MNTAWLTRDKLMGATMTLLLFPIIQQAAPFLTVGVLQSVQERLTFEMIVAEIDSYRAYSDDVKCSPQIRNTIAGLNARIQHEHESNRHWWSDYFSTDRWNAVDTIPLRCETQVTSTLEGLWQKPK